MRLRHHGRPRACSASHPGLIAELEGYEVSEFAPVVARAAGAGSPGASTSRACSRPTRSCGCSRPTRSWTSTPARRALLPARRDRRAGASTRSSPRRRWLRNQWQWLRANHSVSVSLTAGLDSRLTLAAARDVAARPALLHLHGLGQPLARAGLRGRRADRRAARPAPRRLPGQVQGADPGRADREVGPDVRRDARRPGARPRVPLAVPGRATCTCAPTCSRRSAASI